MGVKVHQRQLTVLGLGRTQQGQRDRMVATNEHTVVARHQKRCLGLNVLTHHGQRRGIGQAHVMGIAQHAQGSDTKKRMKTVAQHQAGPAHLLGAKARTGPVGYRTIKGHAGDGKRLIVQRRCSQKPIAVVGVCKLTRTHALTLLNVRREVTAVLASGLVPLGSIP